MGPLSLGSPVHFHPNSLSFSLIWGWLCCVEMLTCRCWEVCWTGSLGIGASRCPGANSSSSHWDHLLMDLRQLAHLFLWYCYFRDKTRPAGFKNMYLRSYLCHQSSCTSPHPYAWQNTNLSQSLSSWCLLWGTQAGPSTDVNQRALPWPRSKYLTRFKAQNLEP